MSTLTVSRPIQSVKRFYFLEYFYVLLKSIEKYQKRDAVFGAFKNLKEQHRLGESKYKKLTADPVELTKVQLDRYLYTFKQVIDEAKDYDLITEDNSSLHLTDEGRQVLKIYQERGLVVFNETLFRLMERRYEAFRYLITFLYDVNKFKPGLLILPSYSPRQLHMERASIQTTGDIKEYSRLLVTRLQQDIRKHLGEVKDLTQENDKLIANLVASGLLSENPTSAFPPDKYNVINKRFRDFWLSFFLREVYHYQASLSSFDIWTYRGKQIGIIHATEFYPNFNGRIVYPTAVVTKETFSPDFERLFTYGDGLGLFVHKPVIEENQDGFVDFLVKAYFDLRRSNRSYFVNLTSLRELVCYNMKISEHHFEEFLDKVYIMNLTGNLKIRISLELDRLPEETKATYLKQELVKVNGEYRNIIAIDVTKEEPIS